MKKTWTARSAAFVLSAALAGQTLATGFVPQNVQAAQEGTQESTTETGKLIDMKAAIEPVKASYGYYVDVYQTNTSANLTPESNASIGVLSKMLDIFTPGDDWNTGTVLDQTTHQANLDKVKEITANRTEEEKTRAYLDDRRNQNYSMTEGLGGYAQTFIDGAEVQTSITDTIPEDATTVKYDDAYGDNAPWANTDGTYGNIAKLVNTIRGGAASTSSAKKYYKYMRPFRWLDDSVILDTLVPCKKADPSNDGGYPSGHTNAANLAAIGMAYAVPERYQELLTRASELGYDRIVAGMHSPLDVMGGRVMSTAIAAANLYDADNADVKSAAVKDGQALVQTTESGTDRFSDYGQNKKDYTDRLTYGFAQTGDTTKAMRVPKGAEVLLESRLPYLTADQRREVLYTTGLPSGYPVLDDEEGWGRLNLFAAADGYGALYSDVTVDMDAANGGFSAADEWKNDIAGGGSLTKEGSGSLTLSGNNSYTGGTDIEDGIIDAADDTALGTGNVTNEAELDVDSTLQVGGDYTQSTDASLKLHAAAAKEALQIDGNAALSGELIVEAQAVPADGIALIQCDGTISGTFDKVTVNGVKGDFKLEQNGDTLSLVEEKYEVKNDSFEADAHLQLTKTAGVAVDTPNPDGGVAEITAYNSDTHEAYVVDGQSGDLKIVPVKEDGTFGEAKSLSVENLIEGFTYGDMTSVSVDTIHDRIAIALQAADYAANGQVAVLDYDGNLIAHYEVGVQPDMVTFTKDGNKILTADEGEPRNGYGEGTVDPAGSVTVIEPDKESDNVVTLGFDKFTADNLTQDHILLNKVNGTAVDPKTDLEPEYIAVNDKGTKAYVSLQEANAIAVVDLTKNEISEIKSLGFVDFSKEENAIDLIADDQYDAKTYPDTYGVRMPDGISLYEKDGKTYLLTTNEGDSREWGEEDSSQYFSNEKKVTVVAADQTKAKKVRALDPDMTAGSEDGKTYLYGSRSFSIFDTDTMDHGRRNLELLETLRHSVLNGCRGFYLNYQPIVSVEDETIIGMEALLRWKNDRFGEVPPGFFIRWLENDACFYELGNWILERALTEGKPIIEKWKDFVINVNIAYPQMERVGFIEALSSILEKVEFPPENLCIELTERCRTLEQNFLTQQIKQIKDMGIKVALDDFGTGFSSLDVLSYLPVDTLKIDRGFVAGISEKVANQVIVRSVAQCANELGVKVCVEGIEDRELADFLKPYGPGSYQGYYFSRPISIEKLKEKYMK